MIHVTEKIYQSLANRIGNLDGGPWEEDQFSADIIVIGYYKREETGIEFRGESEVEYEPVVTYWDIKNFSARDEDGNGLECDFDKSKIKI